MGFVGLAIDLFDGNVTTDFNQADMLVAGTKSHFDRTVQTIVAWLDWLRSDNRTTGKIGLFWLFVRCPHDRTRRSGRPSGCIRALRRHADPPTFKVRGPPCPHAYHMSGDGVSPAHEFDNQRQ